MNANNPWFDYLLQCHLYIFVNNLFLFLNEKRNYAFYYFFLFIYIFVLLQRAIAHQQHHTGKLHFGILKSASLKLRLCSEIPFDFTFRLNRNLK